MTDQLEFSPGEKAKWIVGFPADMDNCEIVSKNEDGSYNVRYQVYGAGKWYDGVGYPGSTKCGGLFKGTVNFERMG
jgi:hypothetical protein